MLKTSDVHQANTSDARNDHHTQPVAPSAPPHIVHGKSCARCGDVTTISERLPVGDQRQFTDIALWLSVTLDLISLDDRPQTVVFTNPDGIFESYIFSFVVHLRDGRRLAIAIEDEEWNILGDREAFFRSIRSLVPQSFADGIALFTQRGFTPAERFSDPIVDEARCDLHRPTTRGHGLDRSAAHP